jgi:hypothetical protein
MPFNITELKSALTFGGARQSLFQVFFSNPADGTGDQKQPFLCRAAGIPESTLGVIQIPYFGRKIPEAGDRPLFQPWQITVINDEDFLIRNAMETWHNRINSLEGNLRTFGTDSPSEYKIDARVVQYSRSGDTLREYTMKDAWPSQISPIRLDWNATDIIEEFNITFQFSDWQVTAGTTGDSGGA